MGLILTLYRELSGTVLILIFLILKFNIDNFQSVNKGHKQSIKEVSFYSSSPISVFLFKWWVNSKIIDFFLNVKENSSPVKLYTIEWKNCFRKSPHGTEK